MSDTLEDKVYCWIGLSVISLLISFAGTLIAMVWADAELQEVLEKVVLTEVIVLLAVIVFAKLFKAGTEQ